jgi:hypothetical protein
VPASRTSERRRPELMDISGRSVSEVVMA